MDEKEQVLRVQSTLQRKFGLEEWKTLDSSLDQWIDKVSSLIDLHEKNDTKNAAAGA